MRALGLTAATAATALTGAAVAGAMPTPHAPQVVDGPTADLASPVSLTSAVARDGSGGLVYLKNAGGAPHVFLASFVGGVFATPVELDGRLPGGSSSPVIGAAPGGALVIAFANSGAIWVMSRATAGAPLSGPTELVAPASSPSLQMTTLGKAYLAYTAPDGSGSDVHAAYYAGGAWALESPPLNQTPGDDAGTGTGRPSVTAAGDGVGIVAWGENGHILARRVWGTSPSLVDTQADAAPSGCTETSADEPAIDSGGDSSYAAIAFREAVVCNGQTSSRVLAVRLRGHQAERLSGADGLSTPPSQSAGNPVAAIGEYGRGWVVSSQTTTGGVGALPFSDNATPAGGSFTVNADPNATPPAATAAIAGNASTFIAWQHDPGTPAGPEIRLRYADTGTALGPETVVSSPGQGPSDAADGLTAAGDIAGDALVAWVQGGPGDRAIVADLLYKPPGAAVPLAAAGPYLRTTQPTFAWTPSSAPWGPIVYTVAIDGTVVGQTEDNDFAASTLGQGPHTWSVTAVNPVGQTSATRSQSVFIDTLPPQVTVSLTGRRVAGALVHLHLHTTDTPPGLSPADGSGVATRLILWGDHTPGTSLGRYHIYTRPGRYRIRIIVTDLAGNVTRTALVVRIKAKTKPHAKSKPKSKTSH